MTTIKQILKIIKSDGSSFTTEHGFEFVGSFDRDEICGQLSFKLPYGEVETQDGQLVSFKELQRYDFVKLYFKYFDTDPGTVTIDDLTLVFDGYINSVKLTKSKSYYNYLIDCLGILGLANERSVDQLNDNFTGVDAIKLALQRAGLQAGVVETDTDLIPESSIVVSLTENAQQITFFWTGGRLLKDVLDEFRERYGVRVHYQGNGLLHIFEPNYFFDTRVLAFDLNLDDNVFEVDYGDLTRRINTVVVKFGLPGEENVVIAVDPTSLQLAANATDGIIRRENYTQKIVVRRDLVDPFAAETLAKNILLDEIQNQTITLKILFQPEMKVTDFVRFNDGDRYKDALFMVKKYDFIINKSDVSCTITCVSSTLNAIPASFILNPVGISDIRVLEIQKEVEDATGWNIFNV